MEKENVNEEINAEPEQNEISNNNKEENVE